MFEVLEKINVPTGHIVVCETGSGGKIEFVSMGDYGKDVNLNTDGRVNNDTPMIPLTDKWVVTISTQKGCVCQCKFCSPAGTLVNTPDGEKPIESLKPKDFVIGFNKNIPQINQIDNVFSRHFTGNLICLELENGEVLKITPEHEVCTKTGYKKAKDLIESDELISF